MNSTGEWIQVRGAREHNLRNVDVDVPRNQLTVITGPSGSGKSSLAFDTLHAEGQRRYLETLRVDSRALFDQLQRPDVDLVEGLPPTLCVTQHTSAARPRSTLATVTEIHDYLRLLWSRLGAVYCYQCGQPIARQPLAAIVRAVLNLTEGRKILVLAPLVAGQKGDGQDILEQIRQAGFVRARVDGAVIELNEKPRWNARQGHTIDMVVDRLVIRPTVAERLRESLETAIKFGSGRVIIAELDGDAHRDHSFTTRYLCPHCGIVCSELEPRHFSFNSPYGACRTCNGLGEVVQIDPERLIPERSWTLQQLLDHLAERLGESVKLPRFTRPTLQKWAKSLAVTQPFSPTTPLQDWPAAALQALLLGSDQVAPAFVGLAPLLQQTLDASTDEEVTEELHKFTRPLPCPDCGGTRLNPEARSVRFAGLGIHEVSARTVNQAQIFFANLAVPANDAAAARVLAQVIPEVTQRLQFLNEVGLGYLTLDRAATTLSGGELQRARLATHLGAGLLGVCYILDEPTIGLHPRDTDRLLQAVRQLQQRGSTVVLVEHDEAVMRQADYLIDMGPGAGPAGGQVLAAGPAADVLERVLPPQEMPLPRTPTADSGPSLTIVGARCHNLKNLTVSLPLGRLVCVTGVSGSGKSTLVCDVLCRAVRRRLYHAGPEPGAHERIDGLENIDKLIEVDQQPLGRSARSTPATYTGIYDDIRRLFASTREAKTRGYSASRFSINVRGGRCEECQGRGSKRVALQLLPDLTVPCPRCHGRRFDAATLEVRYKGRSVADVLAMTVDQALTFFANVPRVQRILQALADVGVGYLTLGQPANTLSGGEAQRVKLATELGRATPGRTLLLLDEPTTGLHFSDVQRLLLVLRRLVQAGNTVVVIEHNLSLIAQADWVIDMGPEAGDAGGQVVLAGTPAQVAAEPHSITGQFLQRR